MGISRSPGGRHNLNVRPNPLGSATTAEVPDPGSLTLGHHAQCAAGNVWCACRCSAPVTTNAPLHRRPGNLLPASHIRHRCAQRRRPGRAGGILRHPRRQESAHGHRPEPSAPTSTTAGARGGELADAPTTRIPFGLRRHVQRFPPRYREHGRRASGTPSAAAAPTWACTPKRSGTCPPQDQVYGGALHLEASPVSYTGTNAQGQPQTYPCRSAWSRPNPATPSPTDTFRSWRNCRRAPTSGQRCGCSRPTTPRSCPRSTSWS